jgi:hypothetical protein
MKGKIGVYFLSNIAVHDLNTSSITLFLYLVRETIANKSQNLKGLVKTLQDKVDNLKKHLQEKTQMTQKLNKEVSIINVFALTNAKVLSLFAG